MGVLGFGQSIVALLLAALHPAAALALVVCARCATGARSLYDAVVFHALVRNLGRVPARDAFLARRVAGPGLSHQVYFQPPEQACVHAALFAGRISQRMKSHAACCFALAPRIMAMLLPIRRVPGVLASA